MVIFGTGVVTGGLLVKFSAPTKPAHTPKSATAAVARPPQTPNGMRLEFLKRAERDLDLSAEQRAQVDKIIAASQERTRKLMEPISPTLRDELQQTREQVRGVLTPDQRVRFDELLKQQHPRDQKRPPKLPDNSAYLSPTSAPAEKQ